MDRPRTNFDGDKFKALQIQYWHFVDETMLHCTKHDTIFDTEIEPCWGCVNECEEFI